jgi:transposase-like protein
VFRWVQRFAPVVIDAARPSRHAVGDRWFVDETHVRANGVWRHVYRAVDLGGAPSEVITYRAPSPAKVIAGLILDTFHTPARTRATGARVITAGSRSD